MWVVWRNVGRIGQNQVKVTARPRPPPVASRKEDILEAQSQGIVPGQPNRGPRMIQGNNPAVGPSEGEGEGEGAAASAPLKDTGAARQCPQGLFCQQFSLRAWRQYAGVEA